MQELIGGHDLPLDGHSFNATPSRGPRRISRNGTAEKRDLSILHDYAGRVASSRNVEELLGIEGAAARLYYANLTGMLKGAPEALRTFDLETRSRRPPRDPVNALLSFCYALLTKDWSVALQAVGLDPLMGFYHRTRYGKPALALDMMEPFRPVVADSVVVGVINNGEVQERDFYAKEGAVLIAPAARKRLIESYERRMSMQIEHPRFGYRCSYRRIFELEARLLSRHVLGNGAPLLHRDVRHLDPKRWRKVFRAMQGFGEHVQLSVFLCDLSAVQHAHLKALLQTLVHHKQDQVLIVDIGKSGPRSIGDIEVVGRPRTFRAPAARVV